jgi:hypothetical protein
MTGSTSASLGQTIYGDGLDMNNHAVGGNDEFHADNAQFNYLFGDGGTMIHRAKGGADLLVGGEAGNLLYGDADLMGWWAVGGNDTLIAGDVYIDWDGKVATQYEDKLYGDAREMSGDARGGDDRLIAGSDAVEMWGDAAIMKHRAVGGNDTFVFADTFGRTRIYDFEKGKDRLEIDIAGTVAGDQVSWGKVGSDVVVTVDGPEAKGEIVLVGFNKSLGTGDFDFV